MHIPGVQESENYGSSKISFPLQFTEGTRHSSDLSRLINDQSLNPDCSFSCVSARKRKIGGWPPFWTPSDEREMLLLQLLSLCLGDGLMHVK